MNEDEAVQPASPPPSPSSLDRHPRLHSTREPGAASVHLGRGPFLWTCTLPSHYSFLFTLTAALVQPLTGSSTTIDPPFGSISSSLREYEAAYAYLNDTFSTTETSSAPSPITPVSIPTVSTPPSRRPPKAKETWWTSSEPQPLGNAAPIGVSKSVEAYRKGHPKASRVSPTAYRRVDDTPKTRWSPGATTLADKYVLPHLEWNLRSQSLVRQVLQNGRNVGLPLPNPFPSLTASHTRTDSHQSLRRRG